MIEILKEPRINLLFALEAQGTRSFLGLAQGPPSVVRCLKQPISLAVIPLPISGSLKNDSKSPDPPSRLMKSLLIILPSRLASGALAQLERVRRRPQSPSEHTVFLILLKHLPQMNAKSASHCHYRLSGTTGLAAELAEARPCTRLPNNPTPGCFDKERAQVPVAAFENGAAVLCLSRACNARCKAEEGANLVGTLEVTSFEEFCFKCNSSLETDTGMTHEDIDPSCVSASTCKLFEGELYLFERRFMGVEVGQERSQSKSHPDTGFEVKKLLPCSDRPVLETMRLRDAVLQQERLDLLLALAEFSDEVLTESDELPVILFLLGGDGHKLLEETCTEVCGEFPAVDAVGFVGGRRLAWDLRGCNYRDRISEVFESSCESEACWTCFIDYSTDVALVRFEALVENLYVSRGSPGLDDRSPGEESYAIAFLMDVDTDVDICFDLDRLDNPTSLSYSTHGHVSLCNGFRNDNYHYTTWSMAFMLSVV